MEENQSVLGRSARVMGAAGVAAGIAGGLVGLVVQGRRDPTVQQRLQAAAGDMKGKQSGALVAAIGESLEDVRRSAAADLKGAAKTSRKRRKRAGKRRSDFSSSAASFGEHMKTALLDGAEKFGENLQDTIDQTSELARQYGDVLSESGVKASKKNREELRKRADEGRKELSARTEEGRKDLMKLRKNATSRTEARVQELESRARELQKQARKTVDNQVRPSLESAAAAAMANAAEARKWFEQEAKDLEKRYQKARPKLEESAEQYAERAAELGSEFLQRAERRAQDAEQAFQGSTEHARKLALDAGGSAREGGRNLTSLIFWLVVAGGIVYALLLDEEKKRKARELAGSAFSEGKAMYQDMRGENADFSSGGNTQS